MAGLLITMNIMLEIAKTEEKEDRFSRVINLLEEAKGFFYRVGDVAIEKKVAEMASQMREPLYIIVAGEYNAGKSSLVNALCGQKILPAGPTPSTHKITLLTYGDDISSEEVDDHQCRMTYPLNALKDITVVDTPGTNSIITEHQAITEGFIHRAELVLFITSADRPFTESEKLFLQLLKGKWGRKLVVILNKIDLKTDEDTNEILPFIEKNFYRIFGFEPKIIKVSARDAFNAKHSQDKELLIKSNIEEVEDFIYDKLDFESRMDLKILSPLQYLLNILNERRDILDKKVKQCNTEIKNVEMFQKRLENKKKDMREYLAKYQTEIQAIFSRLKEKVESFLNYYVNIRSVIAMKFSRDKIDEKFKREVFGFTGPGTDIDRIIKDAIEYIDRNNNILWDMAYDYVETEIDNQRKSGEASLVRKDHHFDSIGAEEYGNLKEYAKQFQELDGELEVERMHRAVQNGFVNFIILEGLAIGIIISLTTFLAFVIPNVIGVSFTLILAGAGFVIFPIKRRKYRKEFFKRTDAVCERFNNLMMFEFEKVVDRVIEEIGNKISAHRDHRWSEREEINRQISDLKLLYERTKELIRKSSRN
ncbi:MAG: dynamin family protein [Candidatus Scalindua sp.]|nr:dynamin family protein [Candidatus Scalindua sp.]